MEAAVHAVHFRTNRAGAAVWICVRAALWALAPAGMAGCATPVYRPAAPADPVTVYLADYGRHSSLLLPVNDSRLVEYTYGDWEFYALNKARWDLGVFKLFCTGRACLGRRVVPAVGDGELLRRSLGARRLMRLEVERARMESLRNELAGRFDSQSHTLIYSEVHDTHFVMDNSRYWLLNTCNNETARWLRALGCRVPGLPVLSDFRVEEASR